MGRGMSEYTPLKLPFLVATHSTHLPGMPCIEILQWKALGHPEPVYENDRSRKAFEMRLPLGQVQVQEAQVGTKSGPSPDQVRILHNLLEDQGITDLMAISGRKNRTKFRDQVLNPLIDAGLVTMTIPNRPRSSKQRYRLTEKGREWLDSYRKGIR